MPMHANFQERVYPYTLSCLKNGGMQAWAKFSVGIHTVLAINMLMLESMQRQLVYNNYISYMYCMNSMAAL